MSSDDSRRRDEFDDIRERLNTVCGPPGDVRYELPTGYDDLRRLLAAIDERDAEIERLREGLKGIRNRIGATVDERELRILRRIHELLGASQTEPFNFDGTGDSLRLPKAKCETCGGSGAIVVDSNGESTPANASTTFTWEAGEDAPRGKKCPDCS